MLVYVSVKHTYITLSDVTTFAALAVYEKLDSY